MKRFKKAYIEITNNCNLNCFFCPKNDREKRFMSSEEYRYIINEIKQYVNFVYLHLMGEPLMHPKLKDILKISKENNIKVNITTNGMLINNCEKLLLDDDESECVRKVSFSLHSFEGNIKSTEEFNKHKELEKIEELNELKKYLDDIISFSKQFVKKNKTIVLKLWNIDSTNSEVEDIRGSNLLNDKILKYLFDNFYITDNVEKEYDILKKELLINRNLKLTNHIYIQLGEKFEWPNQTNENLNFDKVFCYGTIDQFGILVDGTVVPCCLDSEGSITFGNIFDKKFNMIINSEEFKQFFEKIKIGICPSKLCSKCTYARKRV